MRWLPRWTRGYALLATLNICTVVLALSVSHRLREDLADSVAVNRAWSERLTHFADLDAAVRAVDAPGNDVFLSFNTEAETQRLDAAKRTFDERLNRLTDELTAVEAEQPEVIELLGNLETVARETNAIDEAGSRVLRLLSIGMDSDAAQAGSVMDGHFRVANAALSAIRAAVNRIQQDHLAQQQAAADSLSTVEYAIDALVIVMLGATLYYGVRVAREMNVAADERERLSREHAARTQAERSRQEVAALLEASKRIRSSLDLETTLNSILDTVVSMLHCDVAGLALLEDDDGAVLRYAATRGPRADLLRDMSIGLGSGLLGSAARSGEIVIAGRLHEDPRWILPARPGAADLQSGLFVRLGTADSVIGALAALSEEVDHFGETEARLLSGIAEHAALAVEHGRDVAARLAAEEALRRSDERYRLAFDATQDVILDADLETDRVVWSPRTTSMFGFTPEEMGSTLAEWVMSKIHPDDLISVRQTFARSRKAGGAFLVECRHRHANGSYLEILSHGWIVHDEHGRAIRTVGSITDMTQRNQVARELRDARDAALEAARAKSAFLATMSHEIRTPLNGVIGMTGLLQDTPLTARQREYTEAVRRSGETLLALINDILDFSKIEYGRLELEITDLDVREAAEDVVALLADQAQRKGLEIAARVPPDVPRYLLGDPARLRQILTNLVGNAVKFTQHGEVVVHANVLERTTDAVRLRFEVCDTGIGIPDSARTRLFEPFSQADSSTTRRYGGTGLGLAICRRLVELMGGEMGYDSKPGEGSTFWFTIRVAVGSEKPALPRLPRELRGLRVVAVDDNATNRQILEEQLASWGMRVWTAEDGPAALRLVRRLHDAESAPDLVLLDMHMPGMDGLELAHAIRQQPELRETRMVLLTSLGQGELEADALAEAKVTRALTKPVRQSVLFDAIAGAMGGGEPLAVTGGEQPAVPEGTVRPAVLVAEDTAVNQEVARAMLDRLGYRADVVANGREAIDMLSRVPYVAVLMDVQMPEMDGLEATAVIRARSDKRVPIIALTANAMGGDRERCLAAGMDDYLAKPIRMAELAAVLGRWAPLGTPSGPAVDLSVLTELGTLGSGGAANPVPRLVSVFLSDSRRRIDAMHQALARGDAAEVQRLAHAQKGSSSTLGARELGLVAASVENCATRGDLAQAPELLERMDLAYERTARAMEEFATGSAAA